jgi:hypothetical protein
MPACAAPHYAHLWPDRGAPFDGFDGEGRLMGGCETARPASGTEPEDPFGEYVKILRTGTHE